MNNPWLLLFIGSAGLILLSAFLKSKPLETKEIRPPGKPWILKLKLCRGMLWKSGIHLGNAWLPRAYENQHSLVCGTTRSGKSTILRQFLAQIRERNEPAIVVDPHSEFAKLFFDEKRDVMLNPVDAHCPFWTPWSEIRPGFEWQDIEGVMGSLFRRNDEWQLMGKIVMGELLATIMDHDSPRNIAKALALDTDKILRLIGKVLAAKFISGENKGLAQGVLASIAEIAKPFDWLPERDDAPFRWSTRQWGENPQGWIFLSSEEEGRAATQTLQGMWFDLLSQRLLSRKQTNRVWVVAEELPTIGIQPRIPQLMAEGAKRGIAVVIAFQTVAQLRDLYRHEGAEKITSIPITRVILRCSGWETPEWESEQLGKEDGLPIVSPTDIQRLRQFRGFINVTGYRTAKLRVLKPGRWTPSYPEFQLRGAPELKARVDEKGVFNDIRQRCGNPDKPAYLNVECRFKDADEMVRALGRHRFGNEQVSRKGDKGHYEAGNVEWKTREENKRVYNKYVSAESDGKPTA